MHQTVEFVGSGSLAGQRRSAADKHNEKGVALQMQGRLADAEVCYRRAVSLKPGLAPAWSNPGAAMLVQRRPLEAVACLERAIALSPSLANTYIVLAKALAESGLTAEATECWRRLVRLRPDDPDALAGIAASLAAEGKHAEAFEVHDRALRIRPDDPKVLFRLGLLHLQLGDFARGLPLYEHRHEGALGRPAHLFNQPLWCGQPISRRHILLYHEQGLGDTLQFLRYLPLMEAAGGRISLLVQPQLRRLVMEAALPPATDVFDLHCPLPHLPLAFGTTLESVPACVPYLLVPERERMAAAALPWLAEGRLRIGLVWEGNADHPRDHFRSIPFAALAPVLDVEGIELFSLQLGNSPDSRLSDLSLDGANMADAAAKMLHLDLVITVDTAIAHLAGALGLQFWILLDHWPDWRWLLDREDSPWYPTARLFRQHQPGNWSPVIEQVAEALREVRDKSASRRPVPSKQGAAAFASARVL